MSYLQIYNCGNIEEITNSIVISSKEQDMINSMGNNLQLLYNNKIEKDNYERIKHAFINIFSKIFKHKGGKHERYSKKGGDDNNESNNNESNNNESNNNELITIETNINNITSYDFIGFFVFIVGIFIIAIGIYQGYKFCNISSISNVSVLEEFKNTINDLTNKEMGYLSYVWNILTGTTANIMSKKSNEIQNIVFEELKGMAVEINKKAMEQCALETPDSVIGILTNAVQLYVRSGQQASCIYGANTNIYNLELLTRLENMKLLYSRKINSILTIRDMLKYGISLTSSGAGYLLHRLHQIKYNRQRNISGGRKTNKRKTNKRKTNKRKTNKIKTNKIKTNKKKK